MPVFEPSQDALQLLRTDGEDEAANWFYSSHTSRWPRILTPWRVATLLLSAGLAVLAISSPLRDQEHLVRIFSPADGRRPLEPHFLRLELVPDPGPIMPDSESMCVGHILAASSWTANIGLQVAASITECNPASYLPGALHSGVPQLRPAYCTRCILCLIATLGSISNLLTGASEACKKEHLKGSNCGASIGQLVFAGASFGRWSAELKRVCLPEKVEVGDFFLCSRILENFAWNLDILGNGLSSSAFYCRHNRPSIRPIANYGSCVGEITSASAYIASAGLYMTSATSYDCPGALTPSQLADPARYELAQGLCARDMIAFIRTLSLASSKTATSAGHCGGFNAPCGIQISLAAAALSGAAEAASIMRQFCNPPPGCCKLDTTSFKYKCDCTVKALADFDKLKLSYNQQCARYTSAMIKTLATAADAASNAKGVCGGPHKFTKANACASFVSVAAAGFGFMMEAISRQATDCAQVRNQKGEFSCGIDTGFVGDALDTSARGIGGALVNCGFGNVLTMSKPLPLRRSFYTA
ncbi:unnamed protein product [Polarella glacialis]|uniref:Uncharacterized protein n=1 Tax=Polarella glacialis TaxID=89957 RepID=A0A813DLP5_POLGL|nr:unnamed protein product [Polarella glacialis]CAE8591278.1 unnamed protein product [Polarella glacialis]